MILSRIRNGLKTGYLIPFIWLLVGIVWVTIYQFVFGQNLLDSDMAAEMILSDLLNKEHSISGLTTSWHYSTELKFLEMQWLYRVGLFFFPHNWHIARAISMTVAIALLAFATWLVLYASGKPVLGVWAAAFSVFPGGAWYFWQTIYGGYYLTYIYIALFSFALSLMAVKQIRLKRSKAYLALVMFLGVGSGLNGIKQLMVFYAPWVLSTIMVFLLNDKSEQSHDNILKIDIGNTDFCFMVISFVAMLCSLMGYLITTHVLSNIYFFKQYNDTTVTGGSILESIRDFVWSFGFTPDKQLISISGIGSVCGLVIGTVITASSIVLILKCDRIGTEIKQVAMFCGVSIWFCIVCFAYIEGTGMQYLQSIIPLGYIALLIVIEYMSFERIISKSVFRNIMILLLLVASIATVHNEQDHPFHKYRAKPGLNELTTWLRGGFSQGMSFFWTANIVTELSDGSIDMWALSSEDAHDLSQHLQLSSHFDHYPEGRYFYLVENSLIDPDRAGNAETDTYINIHNTILTEHPELVKIYQDEDYTVYAVL